MCVCMLYLSVYIFYSFSLFFFPFLPSFFFSSFLLLFLYPFSLSLSSPFFTAGFESSDVYSARKLKKWRSTRFISLVFPNPIDQLRLRRSRVSHHVNSSLPASPMDSASASAIFLERTMLFYFQDILVSPPPPDRPESGMSIWTIVLTIGHRRYDVINSVIRW